METHRFKTKRGFCGVFLSTLEEGGCPHTEESPVPQDTTARSGSSQLPSVGSSQNLGSSEHQALHLGYVCAVVQYAARMKVTHSISKHPVQGREAECGGKKFCQSLQETNRCWCIVPSPASTFCRQLLCTCAKFFLSHFCLPEQETGFLSPKS